MHWDNDAENGMSEAEQACLLFLSSVCMVTFQRTWGHHLSPVTWEHLGRQMNNRVTLTSVSQHLLVSLIPHSLIKSHRLFRDPLNISHLLQELWLEKRPLPCIYPHIYLCFCLFSLSFFFHDSFHGIKFGLLSEVKVGCGTWGNQNM